LLENNTKKNASKYYQVELKQQIINFLPDAHNWATIIYCEIAVDYFTVKMQSDNDKKVNNNAVAYDLPIYELHCTKYSDTEAHVSFKVTCNYCVVFAGSLCSTEILLSNKSTSKMNMSLFVDMHFMIKTL